MFISNKYISVCIFVCDVMSSISTAYITLVIKIIIKIWSYVNRIYFQKNIRHHALFLTNKRILRLINIIVALKINKNQWLHCNYSNINNKAIFVCAMTNRNIHMQSVFYIFLFKCLLRDHRGRDRMVVIFTTTCAISAYHH